MERRAGTALRASTAVAHRVGDFELTDVLGTGGSASVYAATDLRDGTRVALKILDVEAARHADHRTAFLREAALAAAVRHPGAIRIHESGESAPSDTPPRAWIAMELLPGTTLGAHVREHGPLTPTDALALAATLLEVLRASHRAGVVHRDVTPANVMLGADPATRLDPAGVRLIDFGLAAAPGVRAIDGEHGVLGNPLYISPEQAQGLPVGEASDLYQLGGLLHYALTGAPPFLAADQITAMRAHVSSEASPPSLLIPELPQEIDRLVLRALQKDPAARFASADEMHAAVEHASAGLDAHRGGAAIASPDAGTGARIGPDRIPPVHDSVTDRLPLLAPTAPRTRAQRVEERKHRLHDDRRARGGGQRRRGALPLGIAGVAVFIAALGLAATATLQSGIAPGIASSSRKPAAAPRPAVVAPAPGAPLVTTPTDTARPADRVTMPAVLGLSLEEARAHLEKQGLRVGEISSSPSPRAADTVLAGSENEGTELARDSEVSLTVASGANRIPDVAGMTGQQARSALLNAGFIAVLSETPAPADGATGEPDNGSDSGTGVGTAEPGGEEAQPAPEWSDLIHHSTPSAGTVIPLGSTITLVARPRAPTDPAPPGGTPPPAQ